MDEPLVTPGEQGLVNKAGQRTTLLWLAFLFCLLFGCALIVNIHPVGDGLWYWYATLFRGGQKLYSGLHLNLQPLFILLTAADQAVLGSGWLASKALALVQTLVYLGLLFMVCKRVPWRDWQRAALFLATFGLMLTMSYFRLDDYHITTHIFVLGAVVLLLMFEERSDGWLPWVVAAGMGLNAGLSIANRINDGGSLLVASGIALAFYVRKARLGLLVVLCAVAAGALLTTVGMTGDPISIWAQESILHASKIKGGTGNIFFAPLNLPWMIARRSGRDVYLGVSLLAAVFVVTLFLPAWTLFDGAQVRRKTGTWITSLFLLFVTFPALHILLHDGFFGGSISTIAVVPTYGVGVWVLWRMVKTLIGQQPADWHREEGLLLLPFFQLMSAAMTAGNDMPEVAPAVGITALLLPIAFPDWFRSRPFERIYITCICFMALVAYPTKVARPYAWHHFVSGPMFHNRVIYHHPTLGPMLIGKQELSLAKPICDTVHQDGPNAELLSLPYPYPNYFCGIVPWHGYVQTWYDTSGQETISALIHELEIAPPKWIAYERALDSMKAHERIFRGGKPLPHRALDALIVNKVASGQWKIHFYKNLDGGEWFLLQTHP